MNKKIFSCFCVALLLSLVFLNRALAEERTPEFVLEIHNKAYTMSMFDSISTRRHYWGVYTSLDVFIDGGRLYLFPDNSFLYTTRCDVCRESLKAQGTYQFLDGQIKLGYKGTISENVPGPVLNAMWGWEEKGNYVTGFEAILIDPFNLKVAISKSGTPDYLIRRTAYHDWQKIYGEILSRPKTP